MDYFAIGQRIRKTRRARGISQEQLAEKVGISTTHMSHIENANTKLSLAVFVQIAETLEVQADALLYDYPKENVSSATREISSILEQCDGQQAGIIKEIVKAAKQSFDIYL